MKIWIKYLIGAIAGVILGNMFTSFFADPVVLDTGNRIILSIGKYTFFPLILFAVAFSVSKLMTEHLLFKVFFKTVIFTVLSSLVLTMVGGGAALLVFQGRIPIISEGTVSLSLPTLAQHIAMIFPDNFFAIFTATGNYLMPMLVLAILVGINMDPSNLHTRPVILIFDSVARIFFDINSLIIEFMALGIVFLSATMTASLIANQQLELYKYLLITVGCAALFVIFILIPAVMILCCRRGKPFQSLYALLAPAMTAFFSGDVYFGATTLIKSSFENIGAKRKVGAPVIAFLTVFSRGGTAMVSAASIIIIIKSYTGIEITWQDFFIIMLHTFLLSFILGAVPGMGTAISITMLCRGYGHGIENGYLIIQPVAGLLISFSVLVDITVMGFISTVIAQQTDLRKEISIVKFT
ncbi:MAG: dicarboxylate/amino acid:cation symporter [Spirochaetia bacterium]|nr:dicarboxylate/amino acid:cation symporter [Spirochaetia bacterium]